MQLLFRPVTPKATSDAQNDLEFASKLSALHSYQHNCFSVVKPSHWHLGSHQQLNHFKAEMSLFVFFGTFR